MDPLSITAGVIAVLQATEAVISVCCDYRSAVKGSSWEVPRVLEEVRSLRNVLRILEELADKAETPGSADQSRLPALMSLCNSDKGTLNECRTELERLRTKLTPPGWSGPAGSKRRGLVEALSWPLKKGETDKVLDSIERFKSTISLAVEADQTKSVLAIENNTQDIQTSLSSMKLDAHEQHIRVWLRATDPSPKYTKTLRERQAGTGLWFTNSNVFGNWIQDSNSLLWLHGIPGCGKTVLCSTAIEKVLQHRDPTAQKPAGIAYFYFEFNDQEKQRCDTMLRSLVGQLSLQSREASKPLHEMYSFCGSGASQPSLPTLLRTLKDTVESLGDVFVLVDALDECKERDELATYIEEMAGWEIEGLHMLVTSRKERDIEESLSMLLDDKHILSIQSALVEGDIRAYVQSRIGTDRKLKKWQKPGIQAEIETVLVEKAGGMFQWVKCQLDALGRCLSLSDLRKALQSLPKDLDDTYARILQSIDNDGHGDQVAKIMNWLAYSDRPMLLTEMAEVMVVDVEVDPPIDVERRLEDPQDLLAICSSLVSTVRKRNRWSGYEEPKEIIQFAHFSVREYLGSLRLHEGLARKFAIHEIHANTLIAESCIVYLLQFDTLQASLEDCSRDEICGKYPLAEYAADNWHRHAKNAGESGNILALVMKFFWSEGYALPISLKLQPSYHHGFLVDAHGKPSPIHYASFYGLPNATRELILEGADVNSRARGYTPLILASENRRDCVKIIQLLLEHGAEVNARDDLDNTALTSAMYYDNGAIARTLLDYGADIDAQNNNGETALIIASRCSSSGMVRLLLDRDASIKSPCGEDALMYAVRWSNYDAVQALLKRGVEVDAEIDLGALKRYMLRKFSTALLEALHRGHNDIAELLLEYRADVNARSTVQGMYGVALEHALNVGDRDFFNNPRATICDRMVEFLIENGADLNLVDVEHLNPEARRRYTVLLSTTGSQIQPSVES